MLANVGGDVLQRLVLEGPVLVVVLDRDRRFSFVNKAWTTLLGWTPEDLLGQDFSYVTHPDDLAKARERIVAGFSGSETRNYINRVRHKDGHYRYFSWSAPGNDPSGGSALGVDVTREQEALTQATRSEQRFEQFLKTVPGFVTIVNPSLEIVYINRTYPGVSIAQVQGTNLLNWMSPEWRERMADALGRVFAGKQVDELINVATGPDGGATWYRSTFGAVTVEGEVVSAIVHGEDITRQKRAEMEKAQVARFEAVGRVAAGVAHDLNNILTATGNAAELLAMDCGVPEDNEELQLMLSSIEQAKQLADNLSSSYLRKSTASESLEIGMALKGLHGLLDRTLGGEIQLTIEHHEEPLKVELASHELSQLLINLVVNAQDAIEAEGSVRIRAGQTMLEEGERLVLPAGDYALLEVADTGPGVPESIREHAFDPFFTTKSRGSGLGLATCYGIVRTHGGDIELMQAPGGGTLVKIWLPVVSRAESSKGEECSPVTEGAARSQIPEGFTILLAEDNHPTRTSIARYLGRCGVLVLEARDGKDAIAVAKRHPGKIHALVTDMVMPNMGGLELIKALRKQEPQLPVLAMSGRLQWEQRKGLEELGIPLHDKPILGSQLFELLQRLPA